MRLGEDRMSTIALAFVVTLLPQAKDPDVATISLDLKDTPLGKVLEISRRRRASRSSCTRT